MLDKGLVRRDDSVRPQLFRPAASQKRTQQGILKALLREAYDGSVSSLVLQALASQKASPEELAEIPSAPGSLDEALAALADDHEFLLKGDVFSNLCSEPQASFR